MKYNLLKIIVILTFIVIFINMIYGMFKYFVYDDISKYNMIIIYASFIGVFCYLKLIYDRGR